MTKPLMA